MKVRFLFNSFLPKINNSQAITLYPFVFVAVSKEDAARTYIIAHELIHVKQIRKLGWFKFYFSYFCEFMANLRATKNFWFAYYNVSFEMDAFRREVDKDLAKDVKKVLETGCYE